ncbi:uncharacterized protein [Zea mays]|uniref:DSBA-like thioredoxin domain-containing protein n=1 Tax=Zea mays TaxID=4577 RepID=A0A804U6I2_MAIZE|nr:uncharacterized protein LOC100194152 isoform X2 [Zea mays]|eukprot:XP_008681233.1 uncharacterized protein LOC100194152 isoform X3 [Zea mays]
MPGRLLSVRIPSLAKLGAPSRCAKSMASDTGKKLIQIDVSSDTVCPWCFVGKKNLEKAMEQSRDKFDFEVRWHPFFLNPDAPKEGVRKSDFYKAKFGPVQYERVISRMAEIFRGLGLEYDMSGLTGDTMDSHRLIALAGHQGYDKQNALVGELFLNYFCEGKYIGDKQVLLDAARKVGIEGAEELFQDPTKGVDEINDKYQLSGGQPPNVFMRAFEMAAKDGA